MYLTVSKCRTWEDYHNSYPLIDVMLIADVFESFRNTYNKHYGFDPAHCYTAPGLSWKAALKMTVVTLDLITDIDQHLFIEAGFPGGIVVISRHGLANFTWLAPIMTCLIMILVNVNNTWFTSPNLLSEWANG